MDNPPAISNQLKEAQARLMALRQAQLAARPVADPRPIAAQNPPDCCPKPALTWEILNAQADLARRRGQPAPSLVNLPVTPQTSAPAAPSPASLVNLPVTASSSPLPLDGRQTVKVWPALAVSLAAADLAPHNRLYLACLTLDPDGGRAFDVARLRTAFTDQAGPRYLFSWRRMRQILAQGDGKLWNYDKVTGRLYLRGVARLSAYLGLLSIGRPVDLPARYVFAGQGEFNAHMHAAWLAANGGEERPISQAAIEQATGAPARSQRRYNRVAGVWRRKNYQIGERETPERTENAAWQHGRASFTFTDYHGRRGQPGGRYVARQLPNSYQRRHPLAAPGRRRKIQRRLTHSLVHNEGPGSPCNDRRIKRYFPNGGAAAKARRGPALWPDPGRLRNGGQLWNQLNA